MKKTDKVSAIDTLTEIYEIIYNDNLSDIEALEEIIFVLKRYNVEIESVVD